MQLTAGQIALVLLPWLLTVLGYFVDRNIKSGETTLDELSTKLDKMRVVLREEIEDVDDEAMARHQEHEREFKAVRKERRENYVTYTDLESVVNQMQRTEDRLDTRLGSFETNMNAQLGSLIEAFTKRHVN